MKSAIERTLIACIVLVVGGVVVFDIASIRQAQRLQDTSASVRHTNQVLYQTQQVLVFGSDYETKSKEFLLTGDSALHGRLWRLAVQLHTVIDTLRKLTADDPIQQFRIDSLLQFTNRNMTILNRQIRIRQLRGLEPAAATVTADTELPGVSDRIRVIVQELQSEENRLLGLRREANRRTASGLQGVLTALLIAIAVLLLIFLVKIRADLSRAKKAKDQLSLFNKELEEQVMIKTTDLRASQERSIKRATELAASNAELERFAYVASHDLQEPLRMVSSFLQLLQKKYKGRLDEKADQYIHYAVDGADRMKTLIMDLLEYSRVGSGKGNFVSVDMNGAIGEVTAMYRDKIMSAGGLITVNGQLPVIDAERVQMVQLFQNLIGNSLKYRSDRPPMIRVSAKEEPEAWQFAVSDNGIGIDPAFWDKIFIIFQRLHNKSEYSGTGIGLAICKKIVERHGGRIRVESEPKIGSTFFFTISKHI